MVECPPCQGGCREFRISSTAPHFPFGTACAAGALSRGCSSMAELQPSKLATWVRFPSPAPSSPRRRRKTALSSRRRFLLWQKSSPAHGPLRCGLPLRIRTCSDAIFYGAGRGPYDSAHCAQFATMILLCKSRPSSLNAPSRRPTRFDYRLAPSQSRCSVKPPHLRVVSRCAACCPPKHTLPFRCPFASELVLMRFFYGAGRRNGKNEDSTKTGETIGPKLELAIHFNPAPK